MRTYYNNINGLRAFSAIGIVLMHVFTNAGYQFGGFAAEKIINSFTNLIFLFMMISGFSLCAGYYNRIQNHEISPNEFYGRRFKKIWPFFFVVVMLDLLVSFSVESVYEAFANLTLCFGLLPNASISIIGVGWTLGVIFVFYLLFPFFCFLLSNKKRAWVSFVVAVGYHMICEWYFFNTDHVIEGFSARTSIVYCAIYFMAGCLIYLYRDSISKLATKALVLWWIAIAGLFVGYAWYANSVTILLFSAVVLMYAIRSKDGAILANPVSKYLGNVSMEVYLCHMLIYRVVEKLGLLHIFDSDVLSYIVISIVVILGAIVFSLVVNVTIKKCIGWMESKYKKEKM